MEMSITSLEKSPKSNTILRFLEAMDDCQLRYYAQDWMQSIGYFSMDEINEGISPLIDALQSAEINMSQNIKPVYRCSEGSIFRDWKLSRLGLTFLAFNAPHKNKKLRQLQIKMLSDYLDSIQMEN